MKVMEMINKNVSMDFEALKKHARMNYWHMDEVALPVSNFLKYLKHKFSHPALHVLQPAGCDK